MQPGVLRLVDSESRNNEETYLCEMPWTFFFLLWGCFQLSATGLDQFVGEELGVEAIDKLMVSHRDRLHELIEARKQK